jgi:hypothetical protein
VAPWRERRFATRSTRNLLYRLPGLFIPGCAANDNVGQRPALPTVSALHKTLHQSTRTARNVRLVLARGAGKLKDHSHRYSPLHRLSSISSGLLKVPTKSNGNAGTSQVGIVKSILQRVLSLTATSCCAPICRETPKRSLRAISSRWSRPH